MLSKLFKRNSVPRNEGNSDPADIEKLQYVKVFELELSNMEDTPVYALTHQLSIGSEIGNIIISDPSVSPRHATFILQDEVVSVVDHGSVSGTLINGKKIAPGKYIILEESDVVNVGDLEVRLRVGRSAMKAEEIPAAPALEELEEEQERPAPVVKEAIKPETKKVKQEKSTKKKEAPISLTGPSYSTNALVRVLAVSSDLLLSYALLIVFMPFDEFRQFLEFVPGFLSSLLSIDWATLWAGLESDYGFVAEMLKDAYNLFSSTFHIVPLLIMFAMNRLVTTLCLGVSFSEFMVGMRPVGNPLWTRVGGAIRVLIGMVTWPFLIFDLPAVVSRRTLKELLSFTNTQVPSKIIAILGIIVYLPLMVALALVSPLMQGFEAPETIFVNDKIDQRVKVKITGAEEGAALEAEVLPAKDQSSVIKVEMIYNPQELTVMPNFRFQGVKSKLRVQPGLIFYQRDLQREVEVEVFKTFDFKQLLGIGMKGNVFLYDKYPQIYNFVYEPEETNPAFRKPITAEAQEAFAREVIKFTKTAFSLGLDNALEIMQTETPLIKGLVDYKSSFLSLIEYKEFDQISFMKLGNGIFMKISFNKQRPFDLIVPMMKGEGRIFKVTFDKKDNIGAVSSKFYKFNLEKTNWVPELHPEKSEVLTTLQVFDLFSAGNFKTLLQSSEKAQSLYAYYFETSGSLLKKGDPLEIEIWKSKVANLLKLLESLPDGIVQEGMEDPRVKLLQNFRDLMDALENKNYEYFGISSTATV